MKPANMLRKRLIQVLRVECARLAGITLSFWATCITVNCAEGAHGVASEDGHANHAYEQTLKGRSFSESLGASMRISVGRGKRLLLADPISRM